MIGNRAVVNCSLNGKWWQWEYISHDRATIRDRRLCNILEPAKVLGVTVRGKVRGSPVVPYLTLPMLNCKEYEPYSLRHIFPLA